MSSVSALSSSSGSYSLSSPVEDYKTQKHSSLKKSYILYGCDFSNCDAVFKKSSQLRKHKRTHERVESLARPHICNVCNKAYEDPDAFKLHCKIHTTRKLFACPVNQVCGKRFKHMWKLEQHVATIHEDLLKSLKLEQHVATIHKDLL